MMGLTDSVTPAPLRLVVQSSGPASATTVSSNTSSNSTEKQEAAESAIATVKEVASQSRRNTAAKDAAMQKLTLLKTQLNHLMMFGGDPKTRAREAAEIAKQIGEAARQYAQAGGDSAEAAAAAPSAQSVANSAASSDASSGAPPSTTAVSSTPAVASRTVTVSAVTTAKPAPGVTTTRASGTHLSTTSSKTADQAFMSEARLMARRANAIIESALEEDRQTQSNGETASAGNKALTAIDNAAFALGLGGSHGPELSAGYGTGAKFLMASSAPTVALTA